MEAALTTFKNHPVFGFGVETFTHAFFKYRPPEHNLTSEWDFLYNKAHNEYLNYLATSGIFGFISYLILILFSVLAILGLKKLSFDIHTTTDFKCNDDNCLIKFALLGGYLGILITNFFGFSVVAVSLLFFLFPAIAISLSNKKEEFTIKLLNKGQIIGITAISLICVSVLYFVGRMWYADYLYNQGKNLNRTGNFASARSSLFSASKLFNSEPHYLDELSQSAVNLALSYIDINDNSSAQQFADTALNEINRAITLSPNSLVFTKSKAASLIKLSIINPDYLNYASETIQNAIKLSPNDPKLYYNLGLIYLRQGKNDQSVPIFQKTIELKENYKEPRLALGIIYAQTGKKDLAREQFDYILKYIAPNDQLTIQQLESIK